MHLVRGVLHRWKMLIGIHIYSWVVRGSYWTTTKLNVLRCQRIQWLLLNMLVLWKLRGSLDWLDSLRLRYKSTDKWMHLRLLIKGNTAYCSWVEIAFGRIWSKIYESTISMMRRSASNTLLIGSWIGLLMPALKRLRSMIGKLLWIFIVELDGVGGEGRVLGVLVLVSVELWDNHGVEVVLGRVNHWQLWVVLQCLHNVLVVVVILSLLEVF